MKHFYQNIDGWFNQQTYQMAVRTAKSPSIFVELGVYKGRSAAFMAVEIANSEKEISFFAIDHFKGSAEHGDLSNSLFTEAVTNLKPVTEEGLVNIIPLSTSEAVHSFADNSIDFLFIDASHDFDSVYTDMNTWWSKVKSGGIMAGDDFQPSWQGVIDAVKLFCAEKNIYFYLVPDTCHWIIFKT